MTSVKDAYLDKICSPSPVNVLGIQLPSSSGHYGNKSLKLTDSMGQGPLEKLIVV
jgi:hypothetical protein